MNNIEINQCRDTKKWRERLDSSPDYDEKGNPILQSLVKNGIKYVFSDVKMTFNFLRVIDIVTTPQRNPFGAQSFSALPNTSITGMYLSSRIKSLARLSLRSSILVQSHQQPNIGHNRPFSDHNCPKA